ncbi:aspartate aminotransferase family protein [Mesorhizobium sp. M0514]|uniref:aminotransferase family protein n=1 Tax=Mesorhizobium sp. M0514 TaxID=2956955 RepID=UPI00333918A6
MTVFSRDYSVAPIRISRGEGVFLHGDDGRVYLDAMGSAGVVGIGHGRTEIARALAEAGDSVTFVYTAGFTHPWQEQLSASVLSVAPKGMASVYFVSGGSEANETAVKLARQYHLERGEPRRHKIITRWQSYHGVTLATLAMSGRTSWRKPYDPYMLPVVHIAPPYEYRCAYCADKSGCSLDCADELEKTINLEGPETISAFFAEPIIGTTCSGVVPRADYYRRIREICDRYGVLFVADEVLTGYGRTGTPFAIEQWGVLPDMITAGKAIASGYAPLGAVIVNDKITEFFRSGKRRFVHGFTYSGHAASCFIGQKVFEIMTNEQLFARPGIIGRYLFSRLDALQQRHPCIGEVRGRGLFAGLEFVADRSSRAPFPEDAGFTAMLASEMRKRNVIINPGVPGVNFGRGGDHIQISPPFTIKESEIDQIVDALDDVLTAMPDAFREKPPQPKGDV